MADTTNPFGGGATGGSGGMFGGGMWGGGGYGMQQPSPYGGYGGFGGGYGGYGGMQSPYGGGYGGFGGGMPYGGGYGMQSPYGAPGGYGGGYGGYSPYGMPQGYGGYGMQSPYGGYPMQQQSAYGPYSAMPQQQTMMASEAAPQTMAAASEGGDTTGDVTSDEVTPNTNDAGQAGNFNIGGSTTQTNKPWTPQAIALERLWQGSGAGQYPAGTDPNLTGAYKELEKQQGLGPLGFDPSSEAALQRMQVLAGGANPLLDASLGATQDVASGQARIGTGGMFQNLYGNPGIQNAGQYQGMFDNPNIDVSQYRDMAGRDAIGNAGQYSNMIGQDSIGNSGMYNQLYTQPGIDQSGYQQLAAQGGTDIRRMLDLYGAAGVGTGNYQDIMGGARGAGSLSNGMYNQVAQGNLVNGNPYREQAIADAMAQTSDDVKATMSSRGRYGSDAYGDAMGRALGQVATTARMQGYDTDTANMMAAAQARSGEDLARQGVGLQAASGIAGAQGQNMANRMGAAQSLMNVGSQDYQNRLAALQGLTGAQQAGGNMRLGAAQGVSSLQGTNAAQRLAQIQGLSGIQGTNYQSQLGALGQMNAAQQMANQQRMAAAQGLTGVQGQNWQNQLGAAQGLTGVSSQDLQNRLQAAGMAPAMQGLRYDDAGRLLQAGATREQMAQQQRDYGWNQLNRFATLAGNVPGTAGTSKDSGAPWWQQGLGAAAVAGGIFGYGQPAA